MNYGQFANCVKKDIQKAGQEVYLEKESVMRHFSQNKSYKSIMSNLRNYHGLLGKIEIHNGIKYIVFSVVKDCKDDFNIYGLNQQISLLSKKVSDLTKENYSYKIKQSRNRVIGKVIDLFAAIGASGVIIKTISYFLNK